MRAATEKEKASAMEVVFEVQAIVAVLGAHFLLVAEREEHVDQDVLFRFSRVTDGCARMLDQVADILDRSKVDD